jgi:cytochrome c-type protein NapC
MASQEVWGKLIGLIDTREEFVDHRRSMAEREWQRMKENDSLECRNCHEFEYINFSEQGNLSVKMHSDALAFGKKTCIDCHKGIAHDLSDMKTGNWPNVKCLHRVAKKNH